MQTGLALGRPMPSIPPEQRPVRLGGRLDAQPVGLSFHNRSMDGQAGPIGGDICSSIPALWAGG